jgi:hypothetical protein
MAQQSSAVVALRALIMLLCLVALPLAALFGSSLPAVIKAVREGRWPVLTHTSPSSGARRDLDEPPRFEPSAPLPPAAAGGTASPAARPPGANLAAGSPPQPWSAAGPKKPADVVQAGYNAPLPGASPVMPAAADPYTFAQDRLRQLGATYYLLETWGQQQYRFFCRMAIGGNPHFTKHFEATDSDPLRAIAGVLRQVESWRAKQP